MQANRIRHARLIARIIDSWSIPVLGGIAIGTGLSVWQLGEITQVMDQVFADALGRVVLACGVAE
ncbi:hypothetical protein SAMN05216381_2343 [Pseudomonas seleniipraecipitans]|uniref:Uncharacterized protein n=1 Tax=Phytopseudomonas seleniipraecipitans TaxID=640205 RepID=A0A1G7NNZ8_9GAMM|nr:hypothetical protein SAMN05216381_2343 [Pseudomonas seleniipraecipitans]